MFKSPVFYTSVKPVFPEGEDNESTNQCLIEDNRGNKKSVMDTITVEALPYKQAEIVLCFTKVSIFSEKLSLEMQNARLASLKAPKKAGTKGVIKSPDKNREIISCILSIQNKTRKIKCLSVIQRKLEERISMLQAEIQFSNIQ